MHLTMLFFTFEAHFDAMLFHCCRSDSSSIIPCCLMPWLLLCGPRNGEECGKQNSVPFFFISLFLVFVGNYIDSWWFSSFFSILSLFCHLYLIFSVPSSTPLLNCYNVVFYLSTITLPRSEGSTYQQMWNCDINWNCEINFSFMMVYFVERNQRLRGKIWSSQIQQASPPLFYIQPCVQAVQWLSWSPLFWCHWSQLIGWDSFCFGHLLVFHLQLQRFLSVIYLI